ncbi:ATP-binding protein [Elusimicrobiota bacterium]
MNETENKRIEEIIEAIIRVAKGEYSVQVPISGKNDALDSLAMGINMMIEDIKLDSIRSEHTSNRLNGILETIQKIARGEYPDSYNITGKNDILDALTIGISMMADDIKNDIEKRNQMAEKLKESEERYRAVFQGSAEGILIADVETKKFIYANPAICEMLGYSEEELSQMNVTNIHPEGDLPHVISEFEAQARGEKTLASNIPCMRKDRDVIYADINSAKIIIGRKEYNVGFFTDTSERKKMEDELSEHRKHLEELVKERTEELRNEIEERKKTETQLIQAQKMEAIGTLSGGIAHDFNNILAVISGCTELILDDIDNNNPMYDDMCEIREQTRFAANLTKQLLLFSRQQNYEIQDINLNEVVSSLTKMLGRIIGEDINLNINIEPDLWMIEGDKGNISQVMLNLAVNARDAMKSGGNLKIKTKNITLNKEESKEILYARTGRFICLSVQDTGVGMSETMVKQIFDPFFTTKELGKGTGLGLSVVFGIIKQHDGWINVYSERGKGAEFKVYLPALSEKPKILNKEKKVPSNMLMGNGECILLVEDEESVRNMNKKVLNKYGYKTMEAANAEEGIDIFRKKNREINMVLSDIVLPGKSGIALTEEIFSQNPNAKILLSSGYTEERISFEEMKKKGISFIQKPYGIHDLLKIINKVLSKSE